LCNHRAMVICRRLLNRMVQDLSCENLKEFREDNAYPTVLLASFTIRFVPFPRQLAFLGFSRSRKLRENMKVQPPTSWKAFHRQFNTQKTLTKEFFENFHEITSADQLESAKFKRATQVELCISQRTSQCVFVGFCCHRKS
jgi:hypothetical protein